MAIPVSDSAAIRQLIRGFKAAGWELNYVNDGGERIKVAGEKEALDAITAVDEAYMHVKRGEERGYVFFVLGNDPDEVACDYTVNLSEVVDPITDAWV